jgi:hypothetical protein
MLVTFQTGHVILSAAKNPYLASMRFFPFTAFRAAAHSLSMT